MYGWIVKFKNDGTHVTDAEQLRQLCMSTADQNIEKALAMILNNRRVCSDEVARHLQIIRSSSVG
jgi:hypothetical protein